VDGVDGGLGGSSITGTLTTGSTVTFVDASSSAGHLDDFMAHALATIAVETGRQQAAV